MIRFIEENGMIGKYEVTYDEEKIIALRNAIIEKCSLIEHKRYESATEPIIFEKASFRNFKKTELGEKEVDGKVCNVFLYEYDEYILPKLVDMINYFLEGIPGSLEAIYSYDIEDVRNDIQVSLKNTLKKKKEEYKEAYTSDSIDISELLKKLEVVGRLEQTVRINKNQESIVPYYNELLNLIDLNLIDSISLEEAKRVGSFFDIGINGEKTNPIRIAQIRKAK